MFIVFFSVSVFFSVYSTCVLTFIISPNKMFHIMAKFKIGMPLYGLI